MMQITPSFRSPSVRRSASLLSSVALALTTVLFVAGPAEAVTKISHSHAAGHFSDAGITWSSSGNCSNRYNSTCTSFEQINHETVDGVITLKRASGCSINITGGTETGHASGTYSHWNGYKVDISKYTCVGNYIRNNFSYIGGSKWRAPSGNIYYDEVSHWDITYYTCGC
jgi:hypothetical protein